MRKGIGVSPGVAVGTAYCIHEIYVNPGTRQLEKGEARAELERYDLAREKTAADLRALYHKVATQVGPDEAAIFRTHESILRDPAFTAKIRDWIVEERQSAPSALHRLLGEYTELFTSTRDDYIKERLADVRDVVIRLSGHLSDVLQPQIEALADPLILVANELLPSQVVTLGQREVAGIVTETGGQTSHAAILARSRGVPAVSGIKGLQRTVKTGDTIVVDGREGHVIVNPNSETLSAYLKLQREFFDLKDTLAENRDQPAVSADGHKVQLLANINSLADAQAAVAMGASGVGLFRTEYIFLTHPDVPDEEQQLAAYREIIDASPNRQVTIRTLDLGGDKTIPYLGHAREANPFLGWRSIRLSFEHPEFFSTQIRAILRAATDSEKRVRILFPMITTLEEIRRVRTMVRKAREQLDAEGKPYGAVRIGFMLEVPAAAVSIDALLEEVDFVSIGSNDLVQYLMAADRDNPKVSHLCQPLSPPVLRVLNNIIASCNAADTPVTLCGEMAGAPRAFVLLFGMGLRSFSMSPAFIPMIKDLAGHLTKKRAEKVLRRALEIKTTAAVHRFMAAQIAEIAPNLKLLDSA
ncbi:MAG TPA: phosphoenolpyruvate--protein phosphotransferase [Pirellulales bacterium]|jgi:phosphotransferase system enzyme I (PtsI)|nr:phosphoenolpyruvate--protein phosphotransferase [Pirellulales bacterium]